MDKRSELERERDYYRETMETLGMMLRHTQQVLTRERLNGERHRTTGLLTGRLAQLIETLPSYEELESAFIRLVLESTNVDRAVLLQYRPEEGLLTASCALGFELPDASTGSGHRAFSLAAQEPPPEFLYADARTPDNGFVAGLRRAIGVPHLLWAYHPQFRRALLLGNQSEDSRFKRAFAAEDRVIVESALRVFGVITERKRTEEEKNKIESQLHHAQKMESIGRLAGGVAHDFNNVLCAIKGYTELMLLSESLNEEQKEYLNRILGGCQRAQALTQQLLIFSRKQVVQAKPTTWNQQIESSLKVYRQIIGEDIEVVYNPGNNLPKIMADVQQLDQVLANLLVNARDAIHARTDNDKACVITIETSTVDLDTAEGEIEALGPGAYVCMAVSDTGVGMNEATQSRIFDPFFTTKGEGKGTGLGLSTVFGVIGQNKGVIRVYSDPGKGTTFRIYWPAMKGREDAREPAHKERPAMGSSETLLLVEDDAEVRELSLRALTYAGYRVIEADSGEQALELMADGDPRPDLVITDVVLTGMNGRQLAETIREIWPDLPVLYISGYAADIIAEHGFLEEDIDMLEKPFSIAALTNKLREILDRK